MIKSQTGMQSNRSAVAIVLLAGALAASFTASFTASLIASPSAALAQQAGNSQKLKAVVGFPPGGGVDTPARLFFRYFAKHNGGQAPVVQNMPGAAGVIALNYMAARAPRDGSEIIFDNWAPVLMQLTRRKPVRYDYNKMSIIGAMKSGTYLMFVRKAAVPGGFKTQGDLLKDKTFVFAGQNPTLVLDIYARLSLNLLGVKYKYVSGYRGAPARFLAIQRGEADIASGALQGYRSAAEPQLVKTGHAAPLWYFADEDSKGNAVKDPNIPDMPMFREVYRKVKGTEPSGVTWKALQLMGRVTGQWIVMGPPGLKPEVQQQLSTAFYATLADPEYRKEAQRILGFETTPVQRDDALRLISEVSKAYPATVAEIAKLMK